MKLKIIPYGPDALLVYFAERVEEEAFWAAHAFQAQLSENPLPGLIEITAAFTSILLEFDPRAMAKPASLEKEIIELFEKSRRRLLPEARTIEIPVWYDGMDLQRVADHNQISTADVVALHSSASYRVHLLGFSPGFPYLGNLHPRLHTPRLASPRSLVPAGSVGIGGEHTGIYPVDSPGGWNILGHTDRKIFDPAPGRVAGSELEAFLLKPGDRVLFKPQT